MAAGPVLCVLECFDGFEYPLKAGVQTRPMPLQGVIRRSSDSFAAEKAISHRTQNGLECQYCVGRLEKLYYS